MSCTCTVLGLKIENALGTEAAAGKALRTLVEKAIDAVGPGVGRNLVVSIGPTGSLLLGHLNQANAGLALELAEAIAAQSRQPGYAGVQWAIAGAITQGQVSRVDVLGQSWNLEGEPTIAASRILAKLKFGQLAIADEVICDPTVKKSLGKKARIIPGKHHGERYNVRIYHEVVFYSRRRRGGAKGTVEKKGDTPKTADATIPTESPEFSTLTCRHLHIQAFSEVGLPPHIHEIHELEVPAAVQEVIIPIALCAPLDAPTATDVQIDGVPLVSDKNGLLEAKVLNASSPDWRVRIAIPNPGFTERTGSRHVVEIVYRPVPLSDRVFIRIPANGYRVEHALVVLWRARNQLRLDTSALTIGTGNQNGRYPIVAACFELATNPYARAWDIERFEAGFEHEISWVETWKPPAKVP